jgi:uncharacterized linocin/CFP29 family protein
MNHLLRELAPVTTDAWALIDEEARQALKIKLGARKIVDFCGPLGWDVASVGTGRIARLDAGPLGGVEAATRSVQPLVELRVPFEVSRDEIEAAARGAKDPDLDSVREAAGAAALAEDRAVFHGFAGGDIRGLMECSESLLLSDDYIAYPAVVAAAISRLHDAGVTGPYAIALGPQCYTGLSKTTRDGFPVLEHVRRLLGGGPLVWAPGIDGAAVVSMRGGDFELTVGGDWSIGYSDHTADVVRLYLQESFTFRVLSPEAAVPLTYAKAR